MTYIMARLKSYGPAATFVAVVGLAAVAFGSQFGMRVGAAPQTIAPVSPAAKLAASPKTDHTTLKPVVRTDAQWRSLLTPEQYSVTRQQGTEAPEASPLTHIHTKGIYRCVDCGLDVFRSETKFDSGTGWPSFYAPIVKSHVKEVVDSTIGMERTEVRCARCGAHLGHVFNDGPPPTGLRYCMDGVALQFVADGK